MLPVSPVASITTMSSLYPHIYIVGAHSTGKTTLVEDLFFVIDEYIQSANLPLRLQMIPERARLVHQSGIFSRQDLKDKKMRSHELQHIIQKLQFKAEAEALGAVEDIGSDDGTDIGVSMRARIPIAPLLLCDRSGLDPIAYDLQYAPYPSETQRRLIATPDWKIMRNRMQKSLVVLCPIQPDFIKDDGLRLIEEDRKAWDALHARFCELLEDNDISFHMVPSELLDQQKRVEYVFKLWKNHIASLVEQPDVRSEEEIVGEVCCC